MILRNCPIELFFSQNIGKTIACYGIGNELEKVLSVFNDLPWGNAVSWLMDSDSSKWGKRVYVQGRYFEIKNPQEVLSDRSPDVILVLPTKHFSIAKEILDNLDSDSRLDNSVCYLYYLMKMETGYENIPLQYSGPFYIPPVIHYCWLGRNPLPDLYKKCIDSWHKFCPDYQIVEWNEDNLDLTENDFAREAYEVGKYGFVPDYFRLKIIYEHGGIYLDTDVEMIKSFDDLRREKAFCGLERFGRAALGLGFGAMKGNRQIGKLLETYKNMHFLLEEEEALLSPWLQTRDLMAMGMKEFNRYQRIGDLTVFPTEVLSPKNSISFETHITSFTYSIHHFDGSWASSERKERCSKERAIIQACLERSRRGGTDDSDHRP